jgi:phosphoenolpyruvate carboxykinase (GTP)
MAMKPFCGYHFGDYWQHWINIGTRLTQPPRIFHVNWFRQDDGGRFLWPGFGENLRVLAWILDRTQARGRAVQTPIGHLPAPGDLPLQGLEILPETVEQLLAVDVEGWKTEFTQLREELSAYGDRLPVALLTRLDDALARLSG